MPPSPTGGILGFIVKELVYELPKPPNAKVEEASKKLLQLSKQIEETKDSLADISVIDLDEMKHGTKVKYWHKGKWSEGTINTELCDYRYFNIEIRIEPYGTVYSGHPLNEPKGKVHMRVFDIAGRLMDVPICVQVIK